MDEQAWLANQAQLMFRVRLQYNDLQQDLADVVDKAAQAAIRVTSLVSVNEQVQLLAIQTQQACEKAISTFVTRCLQAIFPENKYQFALIFEEKRGQTECRCVLKDGTGNEYNPVDACGGGVVDIISFALRLATLILRVPQSSKILILDEPFKFLSVDHRGRLSTLLESLCEETGFQIILVTHLPELATKGNVIDLG